MNNFLHVNHMGVVQGFRLDNLGYKKTKNGDDRTPITRGVDGGDHTIMKKFETI